MVNPFITAINQILPEPQAGLLSGILFGFKASLTKDFYQALITTGTVHIVALSGQNISILAAFISQMTMFLGRKISVIVSVVVVTAFILFVGLSASLVRAAIMAYISFLAIYLGRKNWGIWSLFLAGVIMVIINPAWFFDISFQLSFLATLGIILFCPEPVSHVNKSLLGKLREEISGNFKTTLAAQMFTLPVIFINFHRISLIAPITNVLIGWTVTPIMITGFVLSLLSLINMTSASLAGSVAWVFLSYLIYIVELTARIPFAGISF